MGDIKIIKAENTDLDAILQLQYDAFREEAESFNDYSIEPLLQTKEDLIREFSYRTFLKAVFDGRIIGSVRVHKAYDTAYIGKLIVKPEYQNKGLGRQLLHAAENVFPHIRCELNAAKRMDKNTGLYMHCGYIPFKELEEESGRVFIYMEKYS